MNNRKLKKAIKRLKHLPRNKYLFLYCSNKLKHFYLKHTHSTRVAYPSTIMLELTNHCNLACTTCPREYDYGKQMDKGTMPVDKAKKVIDELWPYLDSIGLTGMGETFLYKEINEIVDYIKTKNKGIIISVSTNAVVPNFIETVLPLIGKIDTIQISIDGLNKTYENIRKKSSFKLLDKNLRELAIISKNKGTDILLNMVVTKENYQEMPSLINYADNIGINYMDFSLFNLVSVTNIEIDYYQFYQTKEFLEVLKLTEDAIKESKHLIVTNRNFKTENEFKKCPFPWTHFYICWNGFITPCCAKPFPKEYNFGNAFDTTAMCVLNSKSFEEFRQMWFNNTPPPFCNKCNFIDIKAIK